MTLSPIFTSIGMRCPSSNRPGPTAMTSPSWGFSLAVSGITIPETVVCSSSLGSTAMRSSSGCNPNLVPMVPSFLRASVVRPATAAGLRCVALQPPVLLGQALALLREPNGVGVVGPSSGGSSPVQDRAAVPRSEQVRRGSNLRAPLVPANLPRLPERQVPAAVLESLHVEMGDPAELRHPRGHDHAGHGFAPAARLDDRQSLADERKSVLELRVQSCLPLSGRS